MVTVVTMATVTSQHFTHQEWRSDPDNDILLWVDVCVHVAITAITAITAIIRAITAIIRTT